MLCKKCFEEIETKIVGQVDSQKNEATRVSRTKSGHLVFGTYFVPLYITSKKEITRGKKKGEFKETESIHLFKTKFCSMCGVETNDDNDNPS